jgi:hypothetical protein
MKTDPQTAKRLRRLLQIDIVTMTRSWETVLRNDWLIKFSVYRGNVLLIFVSNITKQSVVKYFDDEDIACEYINKILSLDASKNNEIE